MDNNRKLILLISKIQSNYMKLIENELKQNGLNDLIASQSAILCTLYKKYNGKLSMKELSILINRDKSTMTYLVGKLIKAGYVEKEFSYYGKAKITYIKLTQKAKDIEDKVKKVSSNMMSIAFNGFTEEEKKEVVNYLDKMKVNFML